ncbi:MAG TPA: hypothetical protein QF772_07775, partial [Nitrospinaceae bacterium]|nr:hypothetical protein [Nitrospinaceae bacterium]
WLDLSEEQQDIIRQELPYLDPLGQIHNPAKSGHFKFEIDFVSLRREKGKQEEKLWSSWYAVIKSKPDSDWFPVFHNKGSENKLLFLVFTFDERLGPTPIKNQLKKFRQRVFSENTHSTGSVKNVRKFLDQLRENEQDYRNHLEEVIASRLAVNPKDSYATDLQEDLRKESLVPWAKRRRQIRDQMLKGQRDLKQRVTKQSENHTLGGKDTWGPHSILRYSQVIPSVQSPLCQFWFPIVGFTEQQLLESFKKRFRSYKRNRHKMAGMPLRLSLTGETGHPPILYSPPPRFQRTTRTQGPDKKGGLGFPWLGLTGHLIKGEKGGISKNSPTVIKLLKKNMATDLEVIKNASQYVQRLIEEIDTDWRPQISLPTSPPSPSIPNHNPNWLRERLFPYPPKV